MNEHRQDLMNNLFENMDALSRGIAGHLQVLYKDCPIPRSQLELLFAIQYHEPVSFKHLAQQLYLTPSAISQLAEALEQHELITRTADAGDRRIQCLSVTSKGEQLLQQVKKHRQSLMGAIMESLTDEELAAWLRVQQKLLHHFQTQLTSEQSKKGNA
jgi:DNA-binding MarR family transcriptional regulator